MASEISEYMENRVRPQIQWHSMMARRNKSRFHLFQIIIIITSSVVPIVNVAENIPIQTRLISAILGSLITVITSVTQLKKYEETWYLYRTLAERLKKEMYLITNNSGEYGRTGEDEKKIICGKSRGNSFWRRGFTKDENRAVKERKINS